jgi:prepilin-type N-terminal cleavage/methylation domain-containing protein
MTQKGYTFVEIMLVVAVILILSALAVWSLSSMSDRLLLRSTASDIAFRLEAAKARSVAGTGGGQHGLVFLEDAYVEFEGETYDEDDVDNVIHEVPSRVNIATDILDDEPVIVFSRLNATVAEPVVITISLVDDPSATRIIMVGVGGDISYGE